MPNPRKDYPDTTEEYADIIASRLQDASAKVQTLYREGLPLATHFLETTLLRFFNTLFDSRFASLGTVPHDDPVANFADTERRYLFHIATTADSQKISAVATHATFLRYHRHFDRLTIFFLLEKKPPFPSLFIQPLEGPPIDCLDISDLREAMADSIHINTLRRALFVLKKGLTAPPLTEILTPPDSIAGVLEYFSQLEKSDTPPSAVDLYQHLNTRQGRPLRRRMLNYQAISEACLGRLVFDREASTRFVGSRRYHENLRCVAAIARHLQDRQATLPDSFRFSQAHATRDELEQWLAPHFPDDDAGDALHAFTDFLIYRSGLLVAREDGQFAFGPASIQEYFAACWLEEGFRQLLHLRDTTHSHPAAPPDALQTDDLPRLANVRVWHQSLIYLFENLCTSAADTRTLFAWVFPQLTAPPPSPAADGTVPPFMPGTAAALLATVSIQSDITLDLEQRRRVWLALWTEHIAQQTSPNSWNISARLLGSSSYKPEVWRALARVPEVRSLHLSNCHAVLDLSPIASLTHLEELKFVYLPFVSDLTPLAVLPHLRSLTITRPSFLNGITTISSLQGLTSLSLSALPNLVDLTPIGQLRNLETLSIICCDFVGDLAPLATLTKLKSLRLLGCYSLTHLAALDSLTELQTLTIVGSNYITAAEVAQFQAGHPNTEIKYYAKPPVPPSSS